MQGEAPMLEAPARRVVDAAYRPLGILLSERTAKGSEEARLHEILLLPPEGLAGAFDPAALENAARAAAKPRGRFRRHLSRLDLLEAAEDRFGSGLEEEELLFLLASQGPTPLAYEKPLVMLLASPADVETRGEVLVLRAPWRDFLVEASTDLPPGVTGMLVAGLVEGWATVTARAGGGASTRVTILTPAMLDVTYPGHLPVQEGDHVLVRGALSWRSEQDDSPATWCLDASEVIVPARKTRYVSRC